MPRLNELLTCGGLLGAILAATGALAPQADAACNKTITITEAQQMNFATIVAAPTGGPVIVSPSGMVSGSGGTSFFGAPSSGRFKVTGTERCVLAISFAGGALSPLSGTGAAMGINGFTTDAGANPQLAPPGGQLTFNVGATLTVASAQAAGNYSGSYTVFIVYQ